LSSSESPNSTRPPSGAADRCGSLLGDELKRLERNSIGDHYRGGGCARGGGDGGPQGVMLAIGGGDGVVAVVTGSWWWLLQVFAVLVAKMATQEWRWCLVVEMVPGGEREGGKGQG
jgi:hypothetical protein